MVIFNTEGELSDYFWSKVDKKEDHECWEYKGCLNKGYGMFWDSINHKSIIASRFAYKTFFKREIPENLFVLHRCDNPSCCNPLHLFLGDHTDNAKDMMDKERGRGLQRSKKLLHKGEIWLIRKLKILVSELNGIKTYKYPATYVAKMFKVGPSVILSIWNLDKYPCREGHLV